MCVYPALASTYFLRVAAWPGEMSTSFGRLQQELKNFHSGKLGSYHQHTVSILTMEVEVTGTL